MSKFILFTNSVLSARYDNEINNTIPDDAVLVTDEQFWQTINETDGLWTITEQAEIIKQPFPAPTVQETITAYMSAVQVHMDSKAREYGYDNLISVISYANEPIVTKYQKEGQGFSEWRSLCWAHCEQVHTDVENNVRTAPSHEQLIEELPELIIQA